ncbi:prepilin-type N-terminal cleavage/methylation domain-containing protein [Thauera sp. WH-2]|jgi:general secretion pathway protein J|uniref:prepilin-type N-terminal cleavage/methylation domain-containing protein n=1 Tax=Thauera sp. WH-2 TaxID=3401574 RepID=UPI003AAB0DD1
MRRRRRAGFTLVEVLVGLVLFSLIMTGLLGALRGFASVGGKVDARLQAQDADRVVLGFLRSVLGSAQSLPRSAAGPRRVWFDGDAVGLAWVGVMPPRHGFGGLHHMRLAVAGPASGGGLDLVLQYAPYEDARAPVNWAAASSRALYSDVLGLELAYEDPSADPGGRWVTTWRDQERLPARVSVGILRAGGAAPPPLVVQLPGRPAGSAGGGGFVIGGSR